MRCSNSLSWQGALCTAFQSLVQRIEERAVTVQRVTAWGVVDARVNLLRVNDKWRASGSRVRVADFATAEKPLSLADAPGNRFVVILPSEPSSHCLLLRHVQSRHFTTPLSLKTIDTVLRSPDAA